MYVSRSLVYVVVARQLVSQSSSASSLKYEILYHRCNYISFAAYNVRAYYSVFVYTAVCRTRRSWNVPLNRCPGAVSPLTTGYIVRRHPRPEKYRNRRYSPSGAYWCRLCRRRPAAATVSTRPPRLFQELGTLLTGRLHHHLLDVVHVCKSRSTRRLPAPPPPVHCSRWSLYS